MARRFEDKLALNAEIQDMGHSDDASVRDIPTTVRSSPRKSVAVNAQTTEWNVGMQQSDSGGKFREMWPEHLPRPPSMRRLRDDETVTTNPTEGGSGGSNMPKVIVFNANTYEGSSIVRVLASKGLKVVAVVRVFVNRNTKRLTKLKGVTVKVADLNNLDGVMAAAEGCSQAFLVTKYWERFESPIEENMAQVVLRASSQVGIKRLMLATFEDTADLRRRNRKSQLIPTVDGRIFPKFDGMKSIQRVALEVGISLQHLFASYFDDGEKKRSLILIRGSNERIVVQDGF
uniref:NmrA-like domain-containing protein n=1 Tax=Entomoneis paludosa TaxID=265537 RepID=A0A7S2Y9A0_9STRA|mmetsp:Transcript_23417/g.48613  ORF Transcript_23417/g.48613 Transcript_23417/m.48613 type:complete len:288 (+) Transcript_23417:332-1195(+)|eukprot:CAMPEP_0172443988 /NCGR_PEP_ID=MMETSP1065-20121228/4153_1 /TAXON_ID=265537 /ORGANISM="Amphiprora paludosa, Strain CCMP125" /LENGTH=287 /DNA_ID=CAMNT_0013194405 /DNA_START=250 /DNA_END=1113 /DNA_ORIENTATION=+